MAKGQRRDPKLEGFWREALARFAGSKLSVRGFCALEGLSEPSFYAWRRVIRERDTDRSGVSQGRPAFVPVVVSGAIAPQPGWRGEGIVLELRGGRCLRLPEAMAAERVVELIRVLETMP